MESSDIVKNMKTFVLTTLNLIDPPKVENDGKNV